MTCGHRVLHGPQENAERIDQAEGRGLNSAPHKQKSGRRGQVAPSFLPQDSLHLIAILLLSSL
jgi:hypothetical protein